MSFSASALLRRADDLFLHLAWLSALTFTAWVTATLFWRAAAPQPPAALMRHETDPRKASADLLSTLGPLSAATTPAHLAPPTYRLTAVATGFGSLPGFAVIEVGDGHSLSILVGESTPDGHIVTAIHADRIELGPGRELHLRVPPSTATDRDWPSPDQRPGAPN